VRRRAVPYILLAFLPLLAACSSEPNQTESAAVAAPSGSLPPSRSSTAQRPQPSNTRSDRARIIFLGDSLTAGLGLDIAQSYPSLIQQRLDRSGYHFEVVNAGVSGDTSAGGLRRLDWAMSEGDPKVLVVALGGNDGLRGLPPEQLEENLAAIIERAQKRGLGVILAGMEAPPNFGEDYTARFRAVYPTLAKRYDLRLIPFLLEGVAGNPALNQSDGIHPNPRGAELIADLVWSALEPTIADTRSTASR
jgi:acyl-CoA thioesterase-1